MQDLGAGGRLQKTWSPTRLQPETGSGSWESTGTLGPALHDPARSPMEQAPHASGQGFEFDVDGMFEMEGIDDLPLVPGVSSTGMDMLPDVPPAGVSLEAVQSGIPPCRQAALPIEQPLRHWATAPASAWRSTGLAAKQTSCIPSAYMVPVSSVSQMHSQPLRRGGSYSESSTFHLASGTFGSPPHQQRQEQHHISASLPTMHSVGGTGVYSQPYQQPPPFHWSNQAIEQPLPYIETPLPHSASAPDFEKYGGSGSGGVEGSHTMPAAARPPAPLRASQRLSRSLPRLRYSDFVEDFDDDPSDSPAASSGISGSIGGSPTESSAAAVMTSSDGGSPLASGPNSLPQAAGFLKSRSGRTVRPSQKKHYSPSPPPPLLRHDSSDAGGGARPRPRPGSTTVSKRKRAVHTPAALRDGADPEFGQRRKQHNPWTREETEALVGGVEHCGGAGHWQDIKRLGYAPLSGRSAVDLKDKWRNLMRVAELPPAQALARLDKKRDAPSAEILDRVRAVAAASASRAANGEARPASARARARARPARY